VEDDTLRFLDRVPVVLAGLLMIGLVSVLALAPDSLRSGLLRIEAINLLLRLAVVVVVNVLILVLLYLRLRGPRKTNSGLLVRAPGAYTDVSIESARTLILNAVKNVPEVTHADARVQALNGRADVDLNIQVSGTEIHIPNKQKEINRALKQVINKQLGLQMRGRPRVHIYLEGEAPAESTLETATAPTEAPAKPAEKSAAEPKDDKLGGLFHRRQEEPKPAEAPASAEDADKTVTLEPQAAADKDKEWLDTYLDDSKKQESEQS
jgi:hypothetical protein